MSRIYLTKDGIYKGNLILVNEDILIHENAIPGLKAVNGSDITLRYTAALHLETAMTEINGWSEITPVSGYRSLAEQQKIWDDSLNESGMEFTEKYVAKPAHSEHQTGLAIDLGVTRQHIDFIRPEFPNDGICGKFKAIAAKYGFILRYPLGKEHITKIRGIDLLSVMRLGIFFFINPNPLVLPMEEFLNSIHWSFRRMYLRQNY